MTDGWEKGKGWLGEREGLISFAVRGGKITSSQGSKSMGLFII